MVYKRIERPIIVLHLLFYEGQKCKRDNWVFQDTVYLPCCRAYNMALQLQYFTMVVFDNVDCGWMLGFL